MEQQRGVRIGLQLASLAAVQMRVEREAAPVDRLEQHHARGRSRVQSRRGDGHRGGIGFAGRTRFLEQLRERGVGFGQQVGCVHWVIVGR